MREAHKKKERQKRKDVTRLKNRIKAYKKNGWRVQYVNVGQRVEILTTISGLLHRKRQTGIVKYRNGSYVYVKPHWTKNEEWLTECYDNELMVY